MDPLKFFITGFKYRVNESVMDFDLKEGQIVNVIDCSTFSNREESGFGVRHTAGGFSIVSSIPYHREILRKLDQFFTEVGKFDAEKGKKEWLAYMRAYIKKNREDGKLYDEIEKLDREEDKKLREEIKKLDKEGDEKKYNMP